MAVGEMFNAKCFHALGVLNMLNGLKMEEKKEGV